MANQDHRKTTNERDDRDGHWEDRRHRMHDDRSTEHYGQGQSGYAAGRTEVDRSFNSRNQASMSDQDRDRGTDDRFTGRGGPAWSPADAGDRSMQQPPGNYGHPGQWNEDRPWSPQQRAQHHGGGRMIGDPLYSHPGQHGYGQGFGQQGIGGFGPAGYGNGFSEQGVSGSGYGHQPEHEMHHPRYGSPAFDQQHYEMQRYPRGVDPQRSHRGKGPVGYARSDERIREIVCDCLTDHDEIDASNIHVTVTSGEVTLTGTVEDRRTKRMAEDLIENLSGVRDVLNQLRVADRMMAESRNDSPHHGGAAVEKSGREQDLQSPSPGDKRHRA